MISNDDTNLNDNFYLKDDESWRNKPKESFKFIESLIRETKGVGSVLDIGCGRGDFLKHLKRIGIKATFTGIDVSKKLINIAKIESPEIEYFIGNIQKEKSLVSRQFDLVTMLGVHGRFTRLDPWLNNLLNLTKKGGNIIIFDLFNPTSVDVQVKVRLQNKKNYKNTYFNNLSIETFKSKLQSLNLEYQFIKFNIGIEIKKKDDPLRAYTIKLFDGSLQEVNGIQQLINYYALKITK